MTAVQVAVKRPVERSVAGRDASATDRSAGPDTEGDHRGAHWGDTLADPCGDFGPVRSVLVCDDRREIRDAIIAMLRQLASWRLVGDADDRQSCLAGVEQWHPDVLILDVNLPGGGPQLARAVKEIHPAGHIVVFSGQDGEETRHLMLDAGADQYVVKNGRLKPLLQALDRIP